MKAVHDAVDDVVRFVPSFLLFLVILLVGWLLATLVRGAVHKLLGRVGFHRLAERGGVGRALARGRLDAGDLLAKLVYYAILLFTLQVAFGVWGPNPVSDLIDRVVAWLPRAAVAVVIVVVAAAIAAGARDLATGALGGLAYGGALAAVAYWFILGLGVVAALHQIGIATAVTTPVLIAVLATIAGILIVGVGGGLVRPMQQRWEGWLGRLEQEAPEVSGRVRAAAEARRAEAERQRRLEEQAAQQAAEEAEAARRREERAQLEAQAAMPPTPGPIPGIAEAPTMIVPPPRRPGADDTVVLNPPESERPE